ncbi:hypothetical protein Taro_011802 [Colocasia esculenta]|uniref:Acyl carrier protein n=1 Tax=Colocasia esculenta TaxID=4460 RepID=A0A843UB59_COLES|nr:hypothetical protein [Colocasia esculenta]
MPVDPPSQQDTSETDGGSDWGLVFPFQLCFHFHLATATLSSPPSPTYPCACSPRAFLLLYAASFSLTPTSIRHGVLLRQLRRSALSHGRACHFVQPGNQEVLYCEVALLRRAQWHLPHREVFAPSHLLCGITSFALESVAPLSSLAEEVNYLRTTKRDANVVSLLFLCQIVQAKPETVDKVCEIVRKRLALPPETTLSGESSFAALGADSLDTVEIVMGLEEEFDITIEEDGSQNITTVQEAADLIDGLVQKKSGAA